MKRVKQIRNENIELIQSNFDRNFFRGVLSRILGVTKYKSSRTDKKKVCYQKTTHHNQPYSFNFLVVFLSREKYIFAC